MGEDARTRPGLLPLLYAAVVAVWVLAFLYGTVGQITTFDGHLFNGAFQHYNALRRIDAGQAGGVDFQFYHGLGVPYLHYPPFRLFGGDLFASEAARYLVNLLAYLLPYPLVFYVATRNRDAALGLTAAALVLSEPLGLHYLVRRPPDAARLRGRRDPVRRAAGVGGPVPGRAVGVPPLTGETAQHYLETLRL